MGSISSLFGYILNFIYNLVQNFGFAIILFSILVKLVLLPLSIKQQKTMKKTAKIQGEVKKIQEKYKNDQMKMNQEVMELYKKENLSPFSGCLSSILQIVLLLAIFLLVRNPLTYMLKVDNNVISGVQTYIQKESEENTISQSYPQISILKYVSKNRGKVIDIAEKEEEKNNSEAISEENVIQEENIIEEENTQNEEITENKEENKKEVNLDDLYINMNFVGLDLSNVPKENWNEPTVFIIPILYVITSIASMKLTTKMTAVKKDEDKQKEIIEIKNENNEEENKKEANPEDMTAQMGKSMTWFMPIMSISISLIAPLGLALYWLVNNILMIAERLILNKILKSEDEKNG